LEEYTVHFESQVAKPGQDFNECAVSDLIAAYIAHTLRSLIYIAEVRFATELFF